MTTVSLMTCGALVGAAHAAMTASNASATRTIPTRFIFSSPLGIFSILLSFGLPGD
jgi:hypothetical protein